MREYLEEYKLLLSHGIALVPTGPKNRTRIIEGEEVSLYKVPFFKWTAGKYVKPDFNKLAEQLYDKETKEAAIVLGLASAKEGAAGGIVCIDVDSKYKPGFDAVLIRDLREFYGSIWDRCRIERTPSGGLHLFYFLESGDTKANVKLASREATSEELVSGKTKCFLELKGSGGICQTCPSEGYSLIQDGIGVISWVEHCGLVAFLKGYDEIPEVEYKLKVKTQLDIYSESPWEDFNGSYDGAAVLEEDGWITQSSNSLVTHYGRPGKTDREVSATWYESKRIYKIFTTQASIDPKTYSPSALLCALKFGGNKKECYAWLVSQKFGRLNERYEKRKIEAAIKYGTELPPNAQPESIKLVEEGRLRMLDEYPWGIFWEISDTGKVKILTDSLLFVANKLGYRNKMSDPVLIDGYVVKTLLENQVYNGLKSYIKESDGSDVRNEFEDYLRRGGKFLIQRFSDIEPGTMLMSTKTVSYKFFKNCYLEITKDGYELKDWKEINGCVYEHQIRKRDFKEFDWRKGIYYDFINKAIGYSDYVAKCIGYYAHEFKDENAYFILTTELCENPKNGGGSGKNVFWGSLRDTVTVQDIPATSVVFSEKVLGGWDGSRVLSMSDAKANFDFEFFKQYITGEGTVRKMFRDAVNVPIHEMPKFGASTNYSFNDTDPGVSRRIRVLEFTDYFTLKGGDAIQKEYGKRFSSEWNEDDFAGYDNFMVHCIQVLLSCGCNIEKTQLSGSGWIKKFEHNHPHLLQFIRDNIDKWFKAGFVTTRDYGRDYDNYLHEENVYVKASPKKHNDALTDYCSHYGIHFEPNAQGSFDNIKTRGRLFGLKEKKEEVIIVQEETPF